MNTATTKTESNAWITGACPVTPAVPDLRSTGLVGGALFAAPAAYLPSALGKHSQKRAGMARINTTGWPLGPQDWASG